MDKTCEICNKQYSSVSTRNRHMRSFHGEVKNEKEQHIICPMCPKENSEKFLLNNIFLKHLKTIHKINVKQSIPTFKNLEEFEAWRRQDNREVDYACVRKNKRANGEEYIYYNCNRSDHRGFVLLTKTDIANLLKQYVFRVC